MDTKTPLWNHDSFSRTLAFGTYRLDAASAAARVRAALELGYTRIDGAQLYRNQAAVLGAVRDFEAAHPGAHIHVTSKLYDDLRFEPALASIAESARLLGRPLDAVLLHRPLPPITWHALNAAVDAGHALEIGASNHAIAQLEALQRGSLRSPAVVQVELHPFVGPIQPLLSYCRARGIRVQGHTMLTRGELLDAPALQRLAATYGTSPAVLVLRWAHQLGVECVVSSSSDAHLRELLDGVPRVGPITARDMVSINGLHSLVTRRYFPHQPAPPSIPELDDVTDSEVYVRAVASRLREDVEAMREGRAVSDTALGLPTQTTRQLLTDPLANRIAEALFPQREAQSSRDRYRQLVRALRSHAAAARAEAPPKYVGKSCAIAAAHPHAHRPPRYVAGAPVSWAIAAPLPMPVEVAPEHELTPFFDFLAQPSERTTSPVTFVRGTYFPDQRMDLCKQVVGPDHVEALCAALEAQARLGSATGDRVRHFLLGNNIACEGSSTAGAEALARLMANDAIEIETWYLAGNGIGAKDLEIMARALKDDRHTRALWLKRNPIGPEGAAPIGRLLGDNRTLELLDLHNTGLFDEGVEAMATAFEDVGAPLHLRHLYLSANALTHRSVRALGRMLEASARAASSPSSTPCSIASLHLSINRLGAEGLAALVALIASGALGRLERLDIGAVGLEQPDLDPLVDVLIERCPELRSLDLGTYKSTRDLGEQANRLDADVSALVRLLRRHPSIELLDASRTGLPDESVERLVAALRPHQSYEGSGSHALRHTKEQRRSLRHAARVVDIDSVYRGRA